MQTEEIHIIFDDEKFVEVQTPSGKPIRTGLWVKRDDGFWALQIVLPHHVHSPARIHGGEGDLCFYCGHDVRHPVHSDGARVVAKEG